MSQKEREKARDAFVAEAGWARARFESLVGDASPRRYHRLHLQEKTAILMDWPPPPLPKTEDARQNYVQKTELATRLSSFIAVGEHLRALHLSAPQIYAADQKQGFLLLEDLGSLTYEKISAASSGAEDFYREAIHVLCTIHQARAPRRLTFGRDGAHILPIFDESILLTELQLFPKYFLHGSETLKQEWTDLWKGILKQMDWGDTALLLRDYHTPNLLWLPERKALQRLGLLDYQDAILGPPHYDLVSLLQDARIDVPPEREEAMLRLYQKEMGIEGKKPRAAFMRNYALFGAQKALRILGLFVRLKERDQKPHYVQHIPRLVLYLKRNLAHDALLPLRAWLAHHAPQYFSQDRA